jgi:hypothetical protein
MKKSLASLVVLLLISASASAVVLCDSNPAPFRGGENTTLQTWTFSTDANPAAPDVDRNPYGQARIDVVGGFAAGNRWLSQDVDHQGVWVVGRQNGNSAMVVTIPNRPQPNLSKDIWLQITYSAQSGAAPGIVVSYQDASGAMQVQAINAIGAPVQLDPYYWQAVYSATLPWNPPVEVISITPRDCQVYVDCLTIETQCIPEPMTMGLLGLGSLLLRRRIA